MKPNGYPHKAEAPKTKTDQIAEAFRDSQRLINKMTASQQFHETLTKHGIHPYDDISTERYWDAFANYANTHITAMWQRPDVDRLKLDTLEVLANTPQLLHKQANLDASVHKGRQERTVACQFNSLIGDYTRKHPETSVLTMYQGLMNMAEGAIDDPRLVKRSGNFIESRLRGVQYENAFGQIVAHTGRGFRKSTLTEDLAGFDYEVEGMGAAPLRVDVKAGDFQTDGEAYKIRTNGTVAIAPIAHESEFHDTFFIDDAIAGGHADRLDEMLDRIEIESVLQSRLGAAALHQ